MRKILSGIFCVALCLSVVFILPHLGRSYEDVDDFLDWALIDFGAHTPDGLVDDGLCLSAGCHTAPVGGGIHTESGHTSCASCHEGGIPQKGNVKASMCIVCHPLGDVGECKLVNLHDPSNATCLTSGCHDTCAAGTTTTAPVTTTTPATTTTPVTTTAVPSTTTTSTKKCLSKEIYGEGSEEVEILRYLRDNVLSETPEGQEIIRLYYQLSPVIVMMIKNDEEFKGDVKEMIDGIMELILEDTE